MRVAADKVRSLWFYVYILQCADQSIYTGCTINVRERIKRHSMGQVPATKSRIPVNLICCFAFNDRYKAYSFEKYLKSGSGRAFMVKHFL